MKYDNTTSLVTCRYLDTYVAVHHNVDTCSFDVDEQPFFGSDLS